MLSTFLALLALSLPTGMLMMHLVRAALASTSTPGVPAEHEASPLINLSRVGIGFALTVLAVTIGRELAGRGLADVGLASLATFCVVIAWGFWAQGMRSRWSPALVLFSSAAAGLFLGMGAPSW